MGGSAAVQAAGVLHSEPARDAGMLMFMYFSLWHVLTLIQLACTSSLSASLVFCLFAYLFHLKVS